MGREAAVAAESAVRAGVAVAYRASRVAEAAGSHKGTVGAEAARRYRGTVGAEAAVGTGMAVAMLLISIDFIVACNFPL